jgi:hypothetical protein
LSLITCTLPPKTDDLLADVSGPVNEPQWERYGAYYVADELRIELGNVFKSIIINKRIKILSTEGARFGTIPIEPLSFLVDGFEARLTDSAGKPVTINQWRMKKMYEKEWKVVFPQVTKGSTIDLMISFDCKHGYRLPYEYRFQRPIPVKRGRFVFFAGIFNGKYKSKVYASPGIIREFSDSARNCFSRWWEVSNLLPPLDIDNQPWENAVGPRVAISTQNTDTANAEKLPPWRNVARDIRDEYFKGFYEFSDEYQSNNTGSDASTNSFVQKKIKEITGVKTGSRNSLEMTKALFSWIVRNTTLMYRPSRTLLDVLKSGKGNEFNIAQTFQLMLSQIGVRSDIVCTRGWENGGFDPAFVTAGSAQFPFVVATIGTKQYAADLFDPNAGFGEYPLHFFNSRGLNLTTDRIVGLPPSVSNTIIDSMETSLDLSAESCTQHARYRYYGYHAYADRSRLSGADETMKKNVALQRAGGESRHNELKSYSYKAIDDPGRPLECELDFVNNGAVRMQGKTRWQLSDFIGQYLSDVDSSRTVALSIKIPSEFDEAVIIKKKKGSGYVLSAGMGEITNDLFELRCTRNETDSTILLRRHVVIHAKNMLPSKCRELYPEIVRLNSWKDAYVDVR